MRIAFISDSYKPDVGGIQVVVSELASRVARRGHTVEVLTHASPSAPAGTSREEGVLVHRFDVPIPSTQFRFSPALFRAMVRRRHSFDVVHVHNYHASPALLAAVAGMGPIVFTPHYHGGGHSPEARVAHVVYRPLSRVLFRASAHIVCVSAAEAGALARDFRTSSASLSVIPNGVATSAFSDAEPFNLPYVVVVAAGRMETYKQFDRVALAAEKLPDDHVVVMLGDGPARSAVEQLVADRGLQDRVRVLGRVSDEDVRRWFRTARALVSMSKHESFGLTLLEALAAHTPVVASDIPAHQETSGRQPRGAIRLVSADAGPGEIAGAVAEATQQGLPAGVRVKSWDEVASDMLGIYDSVAA